MDNAKRQYAKEWRANNRDKTRAYAARYREQNRAQLAEKRKEWNAANADRLKELKRAWYENNKTRSRESSRRSQLIRYYGITPEEFQDRLDNQGGRCAICCVETPGTTKNWHVDHCHVTGEVRGILCNHCNLLLGYAKDNTETLLAAVRYLKREG